MQHNFMRQYEIYFQKGTADLTLVEQVFTLNNNLIDRSILLFHLQQAAEKYLKSLLSFNAVHFGKLHDLEKLLDIITTHGIALPGYVYEFCELTPYAVEGRYDILTDEATDLEHFIELLGQFKNYLLELFDTHR